RFFFVERNDDIAELVDPLGHAVSALAWYERVGVVMGYRMQPVGIGIVGPGLEASPHEDHVLKPFGRDESQPASGAREERIEHAGARIEHHVDARKQLLERDTPGVCRVLRRCDEAIRLVARRGRSLADLEVTTLIDED